MEHAARAAAMERAIDAPARIARLRDYVAPLSHDPAAEHAGHYIRYALNITYREHLDKAVRHPGWLVKVDELLLSLYRNAGFLTSEQFRAARTWGHGGTREARDAAAGFLTVADRDFLRGIARRDGSVARDPHNDPRWNGRQQRDRMSSVYWLGLATAENAPPGEFLLTSLGVEFLAQFGGVPPAQISTPQDVPEPGAGRDCHARGGRHSWQPGPIRHTAKVAWDTFTCRRCPKTRRRLAYRLDDTV
jgi:hypothetical protein